jgi:predicted nucleic acid-binding protein
MGIDVKAIEAPILERAVELAFKFNVAVYDACFFALSRQEDCALLTADYKFLQRLKRVENVVKLSELY